MFSKNQIKDLALGTIIILLTTASILLYGNAVSLQSQKGYLNDQLTENKNEMSRYTRPQVLLITSSFFDNNNFTGIVFNEGRSTAHNARISLIEEGVDYEVYIGDIEGQHSVRFSECVPTNPTQPFDMYFITVLWNEKSFDQ